MKGLITILAVLMTAALQAFGGATTIDFNNIPNGTPVSANNPYAGVLNLQAEGSLQWFDGVNFGTVSQEATIQNGELPVLPPTDPPPGTTAVDYLSRLDAVFLQPVVGVSFDAYCFRTAGYSYNGFDSNGIPFTGSGVIPGIIDGVPPPPFPNSYVTFTLSIPTGGYLSSFSIANHDPVQLDGAFWVDNITFTIVPEPSTWAMLAAGTGLLSILRRRIQKYRRNSWADR